METIPFNGSRRILGRRRHQVDDGCTSFYAHKRARELANLASPHRFCEEYSQRRQAVESDPDNVRAKTWLKAFETVARERNITIPVA